MNNKTDKKCPAATTLAASGGQRSGTPKWEIEN